MVYCMYGLHQTIQAQGFMKVQLSHGSHNAPFLFALSRYSLGTGRTRYVIQHAPALA